MADRKEERALHRKLQGQLLRRAMTKAGINQMELGKATLIPQSNISRMLRGELGIANTRLPKIAKALGVPVEELIPSSSELASGTPEEWTAPPRHEPGRPMKFDDFASELQLDPEVARALKSLTFTTSVGVVVQDRDYWERALRFLQDVMKG